MTDAPEPMFQGNRERNHANQTNSNRILGLHGLVAATFLAAGAAELASVPGAVAATLALGYPPYFLTILGFWKVVSARRSWPRPPAPERMGLRRHLLRPHGAAASHAISGDPVGRIATPLVILVIAARPGLSARHRVPGSRNRPFRRRREPSIRPKTSRPTRERRRSRSMIVISVIIGSTARAGSRKSRTVDLATPEEPRWHRRAAARSPRFSDAVLRPAGVAGHARQAALRGQGRPEMDRRDRGVGRLRVRHPRIQLRTAAVLKNAIDWVYPEWNRKAAAFVSYGSAMGARGVQQLRETAIELQLARFGHRSTSPSPPCGLTTRAAMSTPGWPSSTRAPRR